MALTLAGPDGAEREHHADFVVAGTGYRVDVERLAFLPVGLRAGIRAVEGSPVLSGNFESSVPGLYFTGVSSASSFGAGDAVCFRRGLYGAQAGGPSLRAGAAGRRALSSSAAGKCSDCPACPECTDRAADDDGAVCFSSAAGDGAGGGGVPCGGGVPAGAFPRGDDGGEAGASLRGAGGCPGVEGGAVEIKTGDRDSVR